MTHLLPATSSVLDGVISLKLHLLANGHADVRRAVTHSAVARDGFGKWAIDAVHRLLAFPGVVASILGNRLVGEVIVLFGGIGR